MIKRKEAIEGSKRFISILYFLGPKCYDICWDPKCVLSSCWTNKHCRVCQLSLWLVCAAVWWSTDCRSACSSTTLHTSLHCTTLQMHLQRKSAVWNCAKLCPAPARPLHAASTKPRHTTAAAYRKLGLKVDSRYDIGKQIFQCNFLLLFTRYGFPENQISICNVWNSKIFFFSFCCKIFAQIAFSRPYWCGQSATLAQFSPLLAGRGRAACLVSARRPRWGLDMYHYYSPNTGVTQQHRVDTNIGMVMKITSSNWDLRYEIWQVGTIWPLWIAKTIACNYLHAIEAFLIGEWGLNTVAHLCM